MMKDDTSPATKQDVALIMDTMGKLFDEVHGVKGQMVDLNEELRQEIKDAETRTLHQTGLWIETLRTDVFDVKKDQVAQHHDRLADHDRRIVKLEQKVGV